VAAHDGQQRRFIAAASTTRPPASAKARQQRCDPPLWTRRQHSRTAQTRDNGNSRLSALSRRKWRRNPASCPQRFNARSGFFFGPLPRFSPVPASREICAIRSSRCSTVDPLRSKKSSQWKRRSPECISQAGPHSYRGANSPGVAVEQPGRRLARNRMPGLARHLGPGHHKWCVLLRVAHNPAPMGFRPPA